MTNDSFAWKTSSEFPLFSLHINLIPASGFSPLLLQQRLNANGSTWQLFSDSCLAVSITIKVKTSVPLTYAAFWMLKRHGTYQQKFGLMWLPLPRPTLPAVLLTTRLRTPGEVLCLGWDWSIHHPPQVPGFLQLTVRFSSLQINVELSFPVMVKFSPCSGAAFKLSSGIEPCRISQKLFQYTWINMRFPGFLLRLVEDICDIQSFTV